MQTPDDVSKNNKNIQPKSMVVDFVKLVASNIMNVFNKNYKPNVSPEFEVFVRTLDKTPAAIVTMLVQALTGRNLVGGKLAHVSFGKKHFNGQLAMGINRASYVGAIGIGANLGTDIGKIIRKVIEELSLDPVYQGFSQQQLYQIAIGIILYTISRYITIIQTGNDRGHLYNKHKEVISKKIRIIGDEIKHLFS